MYYSFYIFEKTKIVVSFYDQSFEGTLSSGLTDKLKFDGYSEQEVAGFEKADFKNQYWFKELKSLEDKLDYKFE